jgi:hypothetical protein
MTDLVEMPAPEREEFVALQREASPDGGFGVAVFVVLVGSISLGFGLWLALLSLNAGSPLTAFGLLLTLGAMGIGLIRWQIVRALLPLAIRPPQAAISAVPVAEGNTYCFRYTQQFGRPFTVELTTSLLLQEIIKVPDVDGGPPSYRTINHLVSAQPAVRMSTAGGDLHYSATFQLTDEAVAGLTAEGARLAWVIRVLVRLSSGHDLWEDFTLPRRPSRLRSLAPAATDEYQVVIKRYRGWVVGQSTTPALLEVAPHIFQIDAFPALILERQSRVAAERACRRLEADGAVVQLWSGGQRVERQPTHNLPLPLTRAPALNTALPIPAAGDPPSPPPP